MTSALLVASTLGININSYKKKSQADDTNFIGGLAHADIDSHPDVSRFVDDTAPKPILPFKNKKAKF